ncbi:MAG: Peptidoglycan-binding protein ArfA [Acinetobacter bereziniae]|uniref:Peptidoglycan-binding protein ArfA n=1 Tax=Acinetobacter bereziniae TaxID=106648 RepID=A0A833PEY5_ACIBZ|nr:MAG: Peptidoglycan-binding protein ArfA [Acinetobacter bereziniae]
MNIIELLKQQVTSKVLQQDQQFQDEKIGALNAFYPILLTVLKSKPELISTLQQNLNPRLADIFSYHPETVSQFLDLVRGDAPSQEVETTLNHSITPALALLADQAGSDNKHEIFDLIKAQWGNIQDALPAWAGGLFTALGLSVGGLGFASTAVAVPVAESVVPPVEPVAPAPVEIVTPTPVAPISSSPIQNEPKKSNWLLPIIALLVIAGLAALLFKQCSSKPAAVGEPATQSTSQAVADLQAAELQISTDSQGKLANCQAQSSSQTLLDQLKGAVASVFGQADQCQITANTSYAADFADHNAVNQVLTKIKGIPNISLAWIGDQLTIQAPDLAQAQKLADELKGILPNVNITANQSTANLSATDSTGNVDTSNSQADQALSNIQADTANVNDIAAALNLQVINFATGSSGIPEANKTILDKAAHLLKQMPDAKLVVKGFTDNVGNAAANKALSEKRAKSVVAYLVEKGVHTAQLTAEGHGQENPIADNSTKEGQFKNRRIEFEVVGATTP